MLYLDMISGIAGDIFLSLMGQLYGDFEEISAELSKFLDTEITLSLEEKFVNGIRAYKLNLKISKEPHIHRTFKDIRKMLESSHFDENVKSDAIEIFRIIAETEAKIHGKNIDEVHFHEVGAIDSIIDIVGAAWFYNKLNRPMINSSYFRLGNGFINSHHGVIPVPAPATLEIVRDCNFERLDIDEELTTPTGAAIVKFYSKGFTRKVCGKVKDIFYATGSKTFERYPNLISLLKLEDVDDEGIIEIQTNIDDMDAEKFGFLMEKLFEVGALDVFYTPIYMKKNRPAYKLSVLCKEEPFDSIVNVIFKFSSSSGIRFSKIDRIVMHREIKNFNFKGMDVRLKVYRYNDIEKVKVEWEDLKKLSQILNIPPLELEIDILKKYITLFDI